MIYETKADGYKIVPEREALEMYDDMLDECFGDVKIGGYSYQHSKAFKDVDEIAYRCGFNAWCDAEKIEVE
jgi:hypothetical protein